METVTENRERQAGASKGPEKQTAKEHKQQTAKEQRKERRASFRFYGIPALLFAAYTLFMLYLLFLRNRSGRPAVPVPVTRNLSFFFTFVI